MVQKRVTCIICPAGCAIEVDLDREGNVEKVEGNNCVRGYGYAVQEARDPRRILATTVRVVGGSWPLVSVRTRFPIPRDRIFAAMEQLQQAEVEHPVAVGDVVLEDVAGTGIAVTATRPSR